MLTLLVYLQQGNVKNSKILMKIVNIDKGSLDIFQTTLGILVKFSGRTCLTTILDMPKKPGFYLLSGKCSFGKITGGLN